MDAIDYEQLADITGHDNSQLEELGVIYLQSTREHIVILEKTLAQQNWKDAGRTAHAAAGGSAMMGFKGMAEALRTLEGVLDAHDLIASNNAMKIAKEEFDRLEKFLVSYRFTS